MSVLKVYPHKLIVATVINGTEDYRDDEGFYHKGINTTSQSEEIPCQAVPSSNPHNIIVYDDGSQVQYTYTALLDRNCREFFRNEKVTLILLNGVTHDLTVKDFHRYQSNAKIWL